MNSKQWSKKAFDMILEIERNAEDKCPLTLEGCIRSMILKNSDMIQWRDDALNMLYCTLGAGVVWSENGRLIDLTPNNYMNPPPSARDGGVWADDFGMSKSLKEMNASLEIIERMNALYKKRLDDAISVIRDIDIRCKEYRPNRQSWYPLSWYKPNLAVPENAQDDFFWGAIETATIISSHEIDIENHNWLFHMKTKKVAAEILEVLKTKAEKREKING